MKKMLLSCIALMMLSWCIGCGQVEQPTQAAVAAYHAFLFEGATLRQDDVSVSIYPNHGSRYVIQDINGDGSPELIVYQCIFQLRWEDEDWMSVTDSGIYSYGDDGIFEFYSLSDQYYEKFELLNNNAVYCEYSRWDTTYSYTEFDVEGVKFRISGSKFERADGSTEYKFCGQIIESERVWNELMAPYWSIGSDVTVWSDYGLQE